ncbi:hypothetical protein PAPYR_194 [Paratrimastix pyriformis]|uniref:Uncharacterized protein n=1 Tax=Paratrimastix pyriformis TaxID=342808 RepID=A0ABQ8UZH4_9EUKA|nr:hypothetical protein PAPYR_194 [Paratrimastix pyriformis]
MKESDCAPNYFLALSSQALLRDRSLSHEECVFCLLWNAEMSMLRMTPPNAVLPETVRSFTKRNVATFHENPPLFRRMLLTKLLVLCYENRIQLGDLQACLLEYDERLAEAAANDVDPPPDVTH